MMHNQRTTHGARPAFTLVELLVVIAIIAVLVGLGAWGAFAAIGVRQRNTTQGTIQVVQKLLADRWSKVIADAKKEDMSPAMYPNIYYLSGYPTYDPRGERARIILIKVRLAEAFPQSYAEIYPASMNPNSIVNIYLPAARRKPHFARYQSLIFPAAPGTSPVPGTPGESAACLLMALKTLSGDGMGVQDQLGYAIATSDNPNSQGPVAANGIPCFIDSWSNPLAFRRFPWNNKDLPKANPAWPHCPQLPIPIPPYFDPIDVNGALLNKNWYNFAQAGSPPTLRQIYESQFHAIGPAPVAPKVTPAWSHYVIPVIASAGKDGILDLGADLSAIGPGEADNIYSFQLRGD